MTKTSGNYHPLGTLWHSQGALTPLKAIGWYQTGFAWAKAESEKRSRCSCLTHSMHSSLQEKSALRTDTHYLLESQSSLSQKLSARLKQSFGKTWGKAGLFPGSKAGSKGKVAFSDWQTPMTGISVDWQAWIIDNSVDWQGSIHPGLVSISWQIFFYLKYIFNPPVNLKQMNECRKVCYI